MPFGSLGTPSLGLSLLKAAVQCIGIEASISYFNLDFADLIGDSLYIYFSEGYPSNEKLVGEWLFNGTLSTVSTEDINTYIHDVFKPAQKLVSKPIGLKNKSDGEVTAAILSARTQVPDFLDSCLAHIVKLAPKIIGFTSTFQQHCPSLSLAKLVKAVLPETIIVFGGANCEGIMGLETIRQFPFVDIIVSGEGDRVFPELARRILVGEAYLNIKGIITNSIELSQIGDFTTNTDLINNMDDLPYPDFSDFFERWASRTQAGLGMPELLFETSRGCWWGQKSHCTFCGLNGNNMSYRSKSPDRALEELLYLNNKYPECHLQVVDNILDMKYFNRASERSLHPEGYSAN